jgi:hypothetical protein
LHNLTYWPQMWSYRGFQENGLFQCKNVILYTQRRYVLICPRIRRVAWANLGAKIGGNRNFQFKRDVRIMCKEKFQINNRSQRLQNSSLQMQQSLKPFNLHPRNITTQKCNITLKQLTWVYSS